MESEQRKNAIRGAYHLTGSNNFYDGMITCSTFSGKAVCRMVWAMNRQECEDYLSKALSGIPEDFAGKMLEVPVGTGILTMPVYQTLPKADVTCLDYSPDMMGQAKEKAEKLHLTNVKFQQGDVGALPFADGQFDLVLSLNGFHAFPDKEAAYRETFRVLKPGVVPQTRWVEGSNFADVNFKLDPRTNRVVMMGAIDNMVKGAAGQAIQNMNLMFGLAEHTGLRQVPMFP